MSAEYSQKQEYIQKQEYSHFVDVYYQDNIVGHKNIDCEHYDRCLNKHAAISSHYWICNNCKYENQFKPLPEIELLKFTELLGYAFEIKNVFRKKRNF